MKLEFELEVLDRNPKRIVYEVKRKGLEVGLLTLDEPYNKEEVQINSLEGK